MNPFDYANSILNGKEIEFDQMVKKNYNAFMVNRALSMHIDAINAANQMNIHYNLESDMKYKYLFHSIRKKKRPFSKMAKALKVDYVESLMKYYNISPKKALEYVKILSDKDLKEIEEIVNSR